MMALLLAGGRKAVDPLPFFDKFLWHGDQPFKVGRQEDIPGGPVVILFFSSVWF